MTLELEATFIIQSDPVIITKKTEGNEITWSSYIVKIN